MWTRRKVAAMIAAESGTDVGSDDEHSGSAAAALSAVTAAENARVENGNGQSGGTGLDAEVADGVARHREQPSAGLMARGL